MASNSNASKTPAAPSKTRTEKTPVERAADFKRAANARATRVVKALNSLRAIAKPGRYTWTPEQIATLFNRLDAELTSAHGAFRNPVTKSKEVINFL